MGPFEALVENRLSESPEFIPQGRVEKSIWDKMIDEVYDNMRQGRKIGTIWYPFSSFGGNSKAIGDAAVAMARRGGVAVDSASNPTKVRLLRTAEPAQDLSKVESQTLSEIGIGVQGGNTKAGFDRIVKAGMTKYRVGIVEKPVTWLISMDANGKPTAFTGGVGKAGVYYGRVEAETVAQQLADYLVRIGEPQSASRVRCFPTTGGMFTGWMPSGTEKLFSLQR